MLVIKSIRNNKGIFFTVESFLNLVERNLFPNESCDFFFWTSDNSSMIKKHFEALQMDQPLMSFTRLPTLTKSGVSVKRLFSKSYVEMIFKVRRNFCTILVLENPLLVRKVIMESNKCIIYTFKQSSFVHCTFSIKQSKSA